MGIGGGILLITIGAILAFAVHANVTWIDIHTVGWILILAGFAVMGLTIWFWQQRRARRQLSLVEQSQLTHSGAVLPEPPDPDLPPAP
jgi:hypothetical protein